MCINCGSDGIGRRDFMKFGAAGAIALAAGGASPAARAAEGAPTALSPSEALAELKAGNERFVSHPELCSVDLARAEPPSPDIRRPGRRSSAAPTAACRRSSFSADTASANCSSPATPAISSTSTPSDDRIWRRRARLSAHRHPRPHRLRRGEGGLRRGDQERNLSWRDRPDDRADRAGGARGAQRSRRLHKQFRERERETDCCETSGLSAIVADLVGAGKVEDRRGDLRP